MSYKVKRFIGCYPNFDDENKIEELFNQEGVEIINTLQSVVASTADDIMVITTVFYEDCN